MGGRQAFGQEVTGAALVALAATAATDDIQYPWHYAQTGCDNWAAIVNELDSAGFSKISFQQLLQILRLWLAVHVTYFRDDGFETTSLSPKCLGLHSRRVFNCCVDDVRWPSAATGTLILICKAKVAR